MRPKTQKLVITFHTTAAAMAMERLCREGVPCCLDVLGGLVLSLAVGLLVYHRSLVRAFRPLTASD